MERHIAEKLIEEMAQLRRTLEAESAHTLTQMQHERDLAIEASGMGVWRLQLNPEKATWDDATKRIFGWPVHLPAPDYKSFLGLIHPDDRQSIMNHGQRTRATGRYSELTFRVVWPDGQVRWIVTKGKVLMGPDGEPAEWLGAHIDVTASREIETKQSRMQKLEAIGQLAGGVAHDFNNLLVAIMGNVELAKRATDDKRGRLLDEAIEACVRAADLTRQLLAFGRREALPDAVVDINAVLTDTVRMLRRLIPESIEIDLLCARQLPLVMADRAQLEQVIMNLCVNSRDAMPKGGKLTLETETVVINGRFRESHPWAHPGRYVLVTVSDTGAGISADHIDQIFDPFYTTKEQGNGLGLATVYGVVKRHGGLVHVYSEVNRGTTFKVYLPIAERAATAVGQKIEEPVRGGTETILVAEDEAAVRSVVVRVLTGAGYRVIEARDGAEAMTLFQERSGEIDLVLMDAVMPRRGGAEVVPEIRALAPQARIVISSGYTENMGAGGWPSLNVEFLAKPYEPDSLLRVIRRTLDAPRR